MMVMMMGNVMVVRPVLCREQGERRQHHRRRDTGFKRFDGSHGLVGGLRFLIFKQGPFPSGIRAVCKFTNLSREPLADIAASWQAKSDSAQIRRECRALQAAAVSAPLWGRVKVGNTAIPCCAMGRARPAEPPHRLGSPCFTVGLSGQFLPDQLREHVVRLLDADGALIEIKREVSRQRDGRGA